MARRLDDIARALDIGLIHRRVMAHPQLVGRRGVEAPVAAVQLAFEQFSVEDVARHAVELRARQAAFIGVGPDQRLHAMTARNQFMDKVGTDET